MNEGILILVGAIIALWFCIVLPFQMATNRGRSGILWVFIGLLTTPIIAIVLLAIIGDA